MTGRAAAAAREAIALTDAEPARAAALARRVLAARPAAPAEARSVALRALGLALRETGRLGEAERRLREAVRTAEAAGLDGTAAEARMSLAAVLADRGAVAAALDEADRAAAHLSGVRRARLEGQRALLLERLGRLDDALAGYRRALDGLRGRGDGLWECRVRNNRGVLLAYRGDLAGAQADLERAGRLAARIGQAAVVAKAEHNLGFVAARRGDVGTALARYASAEDGFAALGMPVAPVLMDRCAVLLAAGVPGEARRAADQAVGELAAAGAAADLAEARLAAAEAALLDGDPAAARRDAGAAARAFARQGREAWEAAARLVLARAGARGPRRMLAAAREARAVAQSAGFRAAAAEAAALAAHAAAAAGDAAAARAEADAAARLGPGTPSALHARAEARLAAGDRRGALAALRAGMRALQRDLRLIAATELRATAGVRGRAMAELGMRLAADGGRGAAMLAWAERGRAAGLRPVPVRPPSDPVLAALLEDLRAATADAWDAALAGEPAAPAEARRRSAERRLRDRARQAGAVAGGPAEDGAATPARLGDALGDRALAELVALDGRLVALVVARGRVRRVPLGPADPPGAALARLRFALGRLAGSPDPDLAQALAATARAAAAAVDDALAVPLLRAAGDRPLVLVPTGGLFAVPWAALPSLHGRPLVVAPSAGLWLHAEARGVPRPRRVALVAGPEPAGARAEVAALARLHPGAARLSGARARAAAVAGAIDGADLAHVAAHGDFRPDNPLLSSLRMADGPLTVYDLEALRRPPRALVLSACETGRVSVHPGEELMGLSAALLRLSAATVLASVGPVPDDATRALMLALHRGLLSGTRPAAALAAAAAPMLAGDDPAALSAAASFACLGSG